MTSRRKFLVVATAVVLVAMLGIVLIFNTGDGKAKDAFAKVEKTVMPANTTSSLVAPASKDWWALVQQMSVVDSPIRDVTLPDGVEWVGRSEGRSANAENPTGVVEAYYFGFEHFRAAEKYVRSRTGADTHLWVRSSGEVVEFIPFTTEFDSEDFPTKAPDVDEVPNRGVWSVNFTDHFALMESISMWDHTGEFFSETGLRGSEQKPVKWVGVADSPRGEFKGRIENVVKPNVYELGRAAYASAKIICSDDGSQCGEQTSGLRLLGLNGTFTMTDGKNSFGDRSADLPKPGVSMGKDKAAVGFINFMAVRETVLGFSPSIVMAVPGFDYSLSDDLKTFTMVPVWKD